MFDDAATLKGGVALELRLERARTTKDIDLRMLPKAAPPIFRLGEFSSHTLVYSWIVKAFEASKLKGANFTQTEDYI